jgi:hypothetical protein
MSDSNPPPNRRIETGLGNTSKARIFYPDGRIEEYENGKLALEIYYGLHKSTRAAFRAAGNTDAVLSHDYVTS